MTISPTNLKQVLEEGWAGREDHLVCLACLALAGKCHVQEVLLSAQVFEGGDHVGLEVVPSQAVLLTGHGCDWYWCSLVTAQTAHSHNSAEEPSDLINSGVIVSYQMGHTVCFHPIFSTTVQVAIFASFLELKATARSAHKLARNWFISALVWGACQTFRHPSV